MTAGGRRAQLQGLHWGFGTASEAALLPGPKA